MQPFEFQKYIKERCKELNISVAELARETKISRQAMHKIIHGHTHEARVSTMVAMSHGLKIHPIHLFRYLLNQVELPNYTNDAAKTKGDATGFIGDVTYPDNSTVKINQTFVKKWAIQNLGNTDWIDRQLICLDVPPISNVNLPTNMMQFSAIRGLVPTFYAVPVPFTPVGEIAEIEVEFTAPPYQCSVLSYWKMVDAEGDFCFPGTEGLSCHVRVLAI